VESKYRIDRVLFVLVVVGVCIFALALPQIPNNPFLRNPIPFEVVGQALFGFVLAMVAVFALKWRSNKRHEVAANNGPAMEGVNRTCSKGAKSIGDLFMEAGRSAGIKEPFGVDEKIVGDRFQDRLQALHIINPCHVVICTKTPSNSKAVFAIAQKYFEAGVTVTLVHNHRDAPSETQWVK